MQRRLAEVKRRYLLHPFSTALSLIGLRVRVALAQRDALAQRGLPESRAPAPNAKTTSQELLAEFQRRASG